MTTTPGVFYWAVVGPLVAWLCFELVGLVADGPWPVVVLLCAGLGVIGAGVLVAVVRVAAVMAA